MYNTGWAKTRRALDCVFTNMTEISGRYGQILDRSGKKIILLSPLLYTDVILGQRFMKRHRKVVFATGGSAEDR